MSAFFAVHVGQPLAEEVGALLDVLAARAPACPRIVAADAHLTLAFLGALSTERLEAAGAVGRSTTGAPFALELDALGTFGTHAPRVLWWGPAQPPCELRALRHDLVVGLQQAEFSPEPTAFVPHLTLARAKGRAREGELAALVAGLAAPRATVWVDHFVLMRTAPQTAERREAKYEVVGSFELSAPRRAGA